ncbi:hypothetical protein AWN76_013865 [Rhodothermaceae bacterium RA]|nr:hypothetical protein AWN76_013865 [Rhodothermaceae bacterium RA]
MDHHTSRRDFLRTSCCSAALFAMGWSLTGCDSSGMEEETEDPPSPESGITISGNTITLDLTGTQANVLAQAGGFLFIQAAKTVAINVNGQTIRAFTSVCTHQQCDINAFQNDAMVCPCHGSRFNTSGQVVQGPASAPLTEYAVSRDGNTVVITKS